MSGVEFDQVYLSFFYNGKVSITIWWIFFVKGGGR